MKHLICIVCPNGCHLEVDETNLNVTGAKCARGLTFAHDEMTNPKRTVTSSVRTSLPGYPVVSVRTSGDFPKALIPQLMDLLRSVTVHAYLPSGSIVLENVLGTGVNIITTTAMIKETK
jgi:CxxC motif-containing protein